jgi:hypothetical protein
MFICCSIEHFRVNWSLSHCSRRKQFHFFTDRSSWMSTSFYGSPSADTHKRLEKRFKEREDEYTTYQPFYILIGTFNVNNRAAPSTTSIDEWLTRQIESEGQRMTFGPDIIAVGFQEIDTSSGAYIYDDKKKEDEWEKVVRKTIQSCYKAKDEKHKYQLLGRIRLVGK